MAKGKKTTTPKNGASKGVKDWNAGAAKVAPKNGKPAPAAEAVFEEKLSDVERMRVGDELAAAQVELEQLEQDWRITSAEHRGEVKGVKARIKDLTDQWQSGSRKVPAQKELPGTGASA